MALGEKIQNCRKKKGLSQEDLANILNVSRQAVQKWESGASQPELSKIIQLSNILDVSTDFLLKDVSQVETKADFKVTETRVSEPEIARVVYSKHLDPKRLKTIKVWMIIGCVLTPMSAGGSYLNNQYKPEALLFLLLYFVTIPLCIAAISRCKKAEKQSDLVSLGVVCALFVSFIGGIIMLSSGDKFFIEDRPKTKEELEAEERKKLADDEEARKAKARAEEQARKEMEERERQLAIQKENERIANLRKTHDEAIYSLFYNFLIQKYNPTDIKKADGEKTTVISKIYKEKDEAAMSALVNSYGEYLGNFVIDEAYYIARKKKIKKFFAIFTPAVCVIAVLAILTGTVFVPLGKYNCAMSLISQREYDEANEYLEGNNWGDSSTQIRINDARNSFDNNDYEKGIDVLYNLGAQVDVSYELNGGTGKNSDTYKKAKYIDNKPVKDGYSFDKWNVNSYKIGDAKSNYKTDLFLDASWNVRAYSITYNLYGGKCTNPTSYTIETDSFTLNNPTKTGYTFEGWTGTNLNTPSKNVTISKGNFGELVFYANWSANSYTIHLDADGGECIVDSLAVVYNEAFELPFPTFIGKTFVGWFDGENKIDSGIWDRTADLYLKARWEVKEFSLSFELNGGTCGQLPSSYTYFDDDIMIPNATRTGYEFLGWSGTDLTEPTKNLIIQSHSLGNKKFEAEWDGLTYHIYFDPNGGIVELDSMTVVFGDNFELPVPSRTGYTFTGWRYNETLVSSGVWNVPNDVNLVAQWEITTFTLSFNLDGGSISVTPSRTYTYFSETIIIQDPTKNGYSFSGWKNLDTNEITLSGLTIPNNSLGNKSYIALWNGLTYHVSFDPNGGECSNSAMDVVFGTNLTLPVPTRSGYYFNGWWIDGATIVEDGIWNIDHDVSLIAKWHQVYKASSYPSISWGYYPQSVEENTSILADLPNASDVDEDGYIEYSGNKYARSYCDSSNAGRKSDSARTTFNSSTLYYFKVSAISWLSVPSALSTSSAFAEVHTRKVLDRRSFGWSNSYSSSDIKTFLEGSFYNNCFTSFERKRMSKPYLPSTPSSCYDTSYDNGYPTDYALCRGVTLASRSKATVYWVTKTHGNNVCMGVSGEFTSRYATSPTDFRIGVRPLITYKF